MKLSVYRKGKEKIVEFPNIEDFERYFSYTLLLARDAGEISRNKGFKNFKDFVKTLKKAYSYVEGNLYDRTLIEIIDDGKTTKPAEKGMNERWNGKYEQDDFQQLRESADVIMNEKVVKEYDDDDDDETRNFKAPNGSTYYYRQHDGREYYDQDIFAKAIRKLYGSVYIEAKSIGSRKDINALFFYAKIDGSHKLVARTGARFGDSWMFIEEDFKNAQDVKNEIDKMTGRTFENGK